MVDVRYSKETNYGYIIDMHSIVKSVTIKGSACTCTNTADADFF